MPSEVSQDFYRANLLPIIKQKSERQKDLGHGMTNLLSSSRAVVDKHKGGEDIGGQADDGDEVGRDPGRYSGHQPLPVALHQRLEQRASGAAVPARTDSTEG